MTSIHEPVADRVRVLVEQEAWIADQVRDQTWDSGHLRLTVVGNDGTSRVLRALPIEQALGWLREFLSRTTDDVWRIIDRNRLAEQ